MCNQTLWMMHNFSCVQSHVGLFVTLWTVAHQAVLSMGFFQAILESVAISFSKGIFSTQGLNWVSCISCIEGGFLTHWAIMEAMIYWQMYIYFLFKTYIIILPQFIWKITEICNVYVHVVSWKYFRDRWDIGGYFVCVNTLGIKVKISFTKFTMPVGKT